MAKKPPKDPSNQMLCSRARVQFESGNYPSVRDIIAQIDEADADYPAARKLFARTYFAEQDFDAFSDECVKLTENFPNDPQSYHMLGIAKSQCQMIWHQRKTWVWCSI